VSAERPDWEWYRRSCELIAAGDLDAAEDVISAALEAGHLWRVSLLSAPAIRTLEGRPKFESTAQEARRRVEERHFRPQVLTAFPPHRGGATPLLLILHGATGNAANELDRWRPATDLGYVVAAAQSSQPATADGFCWDPPRERVWQDLRAIAAGLPPHARVVLAGFSQGAWIALLAAMQADVVVAGTVIMVGPFAGVDPDLPRAWRRLRVSILIGAEDPYRAPVEALVRQLSKREHHVSSEVIPNLGHMYPDDFADRLPRLLRP